MNKYNKIILFILLFVTSCVKNKQQKLALIKNSLEKRIEIIKKDKSALIIPPNLYDKFNLHLKES